MNRGASVIGLEFGLADAGALHQDRQGAGGILLDQVQGGEPGIHDFLNLLGILGDEIAAADQQIADGAGMLAGGGESLGARTLEGLGGEGGIDPGRIHLAGGKGRRCRPGFQGHKFDVLGREARLFQDHQQQVMVDGALFGGHLFTLEIGDRVDTGGGDDLVVAGGEIIHQHHLLVGPTGDRADRVIEGLAVAIELASA